MLAREALAWSLKAAYAGSSTADLSLAKFIPGNQKVMVTTTGCG